MPVSDDKLGLALIEKEEFQYIIDEYKGLDSEKDIFINSEELYDFDMNHLQQYKAKNEDSPFIYIRYTYQQLGNGQEYFKQMNLQ